MQTKNTKNAAQSEPKVRCGALLSSIKAWLTIIAFVCLIVFLVGGCVRIDYGVFKAKYPNAGAGDYIWHKMFNK